MLGLGCRSIARHGVQVGEGRVLGALGAGYVGEAQVAEGVVQPSPGRLASLLAHLRWCRGRRQATKRARVRVPMRCLLWPGCRSVEGEDGLL